MDVTVVEEIPTSGSCEVPMKLVETSCELDLFSTTTDMPFTEFPLQNPMFFWTIHHLHHTLLTLVLSSQKMSRFWVVAFPLILSFFSHFFFAQSYLDLQTQAGKVL